LKKDESRLVAEFYELKVKQIMNSKVWDIPIIDKDTPLDAVLSLLDGRSHTWVVNNTDEKELVGVITQHDVLQVLAPPRAHYNVFSLPKTYPHDMRGTAGDIMSLNPILCDDDERVVDVLQKMIRHRVRRLPVVDKQNKILGELTLAHLIHKFYLATQYYSIVEDKEEKS